MSQLSLTIDTTDKTVVGEVAEMLLRISGKSSPLPYEFTRVRPHEYAPTDTLPQGDSDQECTPAPTAEQTPVNSEPHVVTSSTTQLDSAGVPWDERIHSSSRGTVVNGTWKKRKNLPDEVYEQVMAELRGNGSTSPTQNNEITVTQPVAHITDSVTPPPPPPPPIENTTGNSSPATFAELMQRVTANRVPIQKLQEWCTKEGLGSFSLLGQHPDRIADAALALGV
jgi:hypothetical protein